MFRVPSGIHTWDRWTSAWSGFDEGTFAEAKQGRKQASKQAGHGSRQTIEDPAVMFRDVAERTSKRVTSFG